MFSEDLERWFTIGALWFSTNQFSRIEVHRDLIQPHGIVRYASICRDLYWPQRIVILGFFPGDMGGIPLNLQKLPPNRGIFDIFQIFVNLRVKQPIFSTQDPEICEQ